MNNLSLRKITTAFSFALKTIRTHKARTFLALLGVVIGVFAVVIVMTLGDGVKGFILGQVESFGADLIQVEVKIPGTGTQSSGNATGRAQGTQITTLTVKDGEAIHKLPNVVAVYAGTIGQERATAGSVEKRILLFGTGADVVQVDRNAKLSSGRFFTEGEDASLSRVVVLGSETKKTFFGESEAVGQSITLKGEKYRVIGVLTSRGTVAFLNFDTFTYVPIQTLQKKILGVEYVQMISVQMKDVSHEKETVADIVALLRKRHDIDNPNKDDFAVSSTKEAQQTLGDVLGSMTILLLALTSISLVVGGVGIMNVMYVSVSERTSEIGLRKAVGATSGGILRQFLFEALIITFMGGLIGIILGSLLSFGLSILFQRLGYDVVLQFSLTSFFLGAGFSMAVGLIFGIAPAYRASKLSPMEALRRE
ncbi:MAG: ABC transporter permease [Candidatus Moranbacteria bacterium]|nr:ABC transporter permease [Candidatus Moranbacteria bacterium]MDD3965063.1 ABC transporter permease [Candidatus Moranbacteria bacterium]